ncbi:MAG TPA: tRNA guanosine(34) transglycosylase Tgt [Thermomicrobiaceae bacterium]|nr:tRNA guanosine(34) transglycosylase Tgt [Thermomicrobiaceae bacterium]
MADGDSGSEPAHDCLSCFTIDASDIETRARAGTLRTRRGAVATPAFMPVGTQAAVKALSPDEVRATGAEILLANTYHLMLRPGIDIVRAAGGLHEFMAWDGPILTDSGGFQVYSLAERHDVSEAGVRFRSHLDGSTWDLSPESSLGLQLGFGSDVIMPLDDVVGYPSTPDEQERATSRTHRWLARTVRRFQQFEEQSDGARPLLFGIAQGGFSPQERRASVRFVAEQPVDGLAIGGLSVGEPKELMQELLGASVEPAPADRPRYMMGVGSPEDLWAGVAAGVDLFDCVHPTRVARRGGLFTRAGRVNITASRFRSEFRPIEDDCDCATCRTFTIAYLHHLFHARELLAYRLASIHNLRFVQREMARMRNGIRAGTFASDMRAFLGGYHTADRDAAELQRSRLREARQRAGS